MAEIKSAYVMLDGRKTTATFDSKTGLWTAAVTAPSESSWSQEGHVYNAEIHADDAAGNSAVMKTTDTTYGAQLRIRVLEKTAPVATIVSPTAGSVLGSAEQTISLKISDAGNSGLNMESIKFTVNGNVIANTNLTWADASGAKTATYKATGLPDGSNTITLDVSDNDGNKATHASTNFVISTAAPTLNVTSPADKILTNQNKVTVSGIAKPGSASVTLSSVKINDVDAKPVADGKFSLEVTLTEGANTVKIIATDSLGKSTTVTRTITLDSKAPVISDVKTVSTTVDAGKTITITFKVVDAA